MKRNAKYIFITVCISLLLSLAVAAAYPVGDADGNGVFSESDVMRVVTALSKDAFSEGELYTFDVNKSGDITLKDALELAKLSLGNRVKPSLCNVNNRYHSGCIWDYLTVGADNVLTFTSNDYKDVKIRFKMYIPESYSPHKSYALVTHLHGLGGENNNTANLSGSTFFSNIRASEYGEDTIYLLPQCPVGMTWPDDRETIEVTYRLIMDLSEHISIDKSRLYISGHSNGSKGVAYMIMEHPNTFAAAVMGSGASASKYYTNIRNIATTPIWMFIGTADEISGFYRNVNDLYYALENIGADVKYTEFEGLGHNIFSTVGNTAGLIDWVYSKTLK